MTTPHETLVLVREQFQAGRLDEAENLCRSLLTEEPQHSPAWHLLGIICCRRGRYEAALDALNRSLAIDSTNPDCLKNLGEVYQLLCRWDDAVECYRKALRIHPDNAEFCNNLGKTLKAQGKLDEAAECYRQALTLNPEFAEVHNNLGNVLLSREKIDEAEKCYRRCLELNPHLAQAWNNLAVALAERNQLLEAVENYNRALELQPDFPEALKNLGLALAALGKPDEAIHCFQRALKISPNFVGACVNLGNVYKAQGRLDEAYNAYQQALDFDPNSAVIHNNLGIVWTKLSRMDEAVHSFKRALDLNPNFVEAWNNLGITLAELCRWDGAVTAFRRAIAIRPNSAEAHGNLGLVLNYQGKLNDAVDSLQHALSLRPQYAKALHNLGVTFKDQGRLEEAIEAFERALQIEPENSSARSAFLMTLHYSPDVSAERLLKESLAWAERHAPEVLTRPPQIHRADPEKKLRIGYVSGDLRKHPVGYLLEPVLAAHDRSQVEVFCYANQVLNDELSDRMKLTVDRWRSVAGCSDERLKNLIREDAVDILVDLSGHTDRNRLSVFADKPAPVQATWLGYFSTTGLKAIDYLIADATVVPDGEERFYVEKVMRLPECWFCFCPPTENVEVGPLPAPSSGRITFGCFNNITKVTPEVVSLWAKILRAVPDSRLYLKTMAMGDAGTRARYEELFAEQDIGPEQLVFAGRSSREEMHAVFNEIDIGLDPFPFNGATTTLETLWMGVPVISLRGKGRFVSHMAESILNTAGLSEFVADSREEYVSKAVNLATDLPRLGDLRSGIRQRLLASPLCDAKQFTRDLERLYREMWRSWCGAGASNS